METMEDFRVNVPERPGAEEEPSGLRRWLPPVVFDGVQAAAGRVVEREPERSFVPVMLLFGLALAVQYFQLSIPVVSDFLRYHDIRGRAAWMGFLILKQWTLFVLMLLALALKENTLDDIGFPKIDSRRLALALGLAGAAVGAALLNLPQMTLLEEQINYMLPNTPGERVLSVLVAFTAAVVEESFFRGFAIVWIYRWSGHLGLAVVFPAIVFASGHAYLSGENVVFAFLVALVFSALFLWRRDLYWPMVIHFAINNLDLFN
jgi:membrane protease YdiL (CAAX protease family)